MAILKKGQEIGVCVHHSVYQAAKNLTELKDHAVKFNSWHKSKSWAEKTKTSGDYPYISYHYLIALDGSILQVTDEKYVKYHAGDNFRGDSSFNLHGIAVCIDGNYETRVPNDKQMETLVKLIRDVQKRYKIDALVRGHKETSKTATACPGKNIGTHDSGWLKKVITNTNDSNYPPKPPELTELEKCQLQLETLKKKNTSLTESLRVSDGALKLERERVEFLEGSLAVNDSEYKELEVERDRLQEERDRFEKDCIECVTELNDLKQGRDSILKYIGDIIYKLFKGKNE